MTRFSYSTRRTTAIQVFNSLGNYSYTSVNAFGQRGELPGQRQMTVGLGPGRTKYEAKYDPRTNQMTVIKTGPNPLPKVTLPGLVLLRMTTSGNSIVIEY